MTRKKSIILIVFSLLLALTVAVSGCAGKGETVIVKAMDAVTMPFSDAYAHLGLPGTAAEAYDPTFPPPAVIVEDGVQIGGAPYTVILNPETEVLMRDAAEIDLDTDTVSSIQFDLSDETLSGDVSLEKLHSTALAIYEEIKDALGEPNSAENEGLSTASFEDARNINAFGELAVNASGLGVRWDLAEENRKVTLGFSVSGSEGDYTASSTVTVYRLEK